MKIRFQSFEEWNQHAVRFLKHPLQPESTRFVNQTISVIPALSVHKELFILCSEWIPVSASGEGTFERMVHTPDQYLGKAKSVRRENDAYVSNELDTLEVNDPAILVGGCANYYHWLIDYLPRFLVADSFQEFEGWSLILNSDLQLFQAEAIQMLGIPSRQILTVKDHCKIVGATVLVPTLLTHKTVCHSAVPQMLRDSFPPTEVSERRRRIYLCREDASSRRLVNHCDVLQILEDYGFEMSMPGQLGFQEQINLCAQADAIFAVHGAAMANLVFCHPDTLVFEVSNPARRVTSMLVLSKYARLKHGFIDAKGSSLRPTGNPLLDDWWVDVDAMRKKLSRAFPKNS